MGFFGVVGVIVVIGLVVWLIVALVGGSSKKEEERKFATSFHAKITRWDNLTVILFDKYKADRRIEKSELDELSSLNSYVETNFRSYSFHTESPTQFCSEVEELIELRKEFVITLREYCESYQSYNSYTPSPKTSPSNSYSSQNNSTISKWWTFLNCSSEPKTQAEYETAYKQERLRLKRMGQDIMNLNSKYEENKKRFR